AAELPPPAPVSGPVGSLVAATGPSGSGSLAASPPPQALAHHNRQLTNPLRGAQVLGIAIAPASHRRTRSASGPARFARRCAALGERVGKSRRQRTLESCQISYHAPTSTAYHAPTSTTYHAPTSTTYHAPTS